MKKEMSLTQKGIMNAASTVIGMLIPIFVYPYILRTIGVEAYGKISFAQTFASYFVILATLGVSNYAQRECAPARQNQELFNQKVSQIIIVNIILTVFSMIVYFLVITLVPGLRVDFAVYAVWSILVLAAGMKMEWMYVSTEQFNITSIRNIISKLIYLVLCFLVVKKSGQYMQYSLVYVSALVLLPFFMNYYGLFVKKDCLQFHFTKPVEMVSCICPIVYLSMLTIGSKIFSSLDVLMIRAMEGERAVGIYSAATKLPLVLDELLMAVAAVVTPRLYTAVKQNDEKETVRVCNVTSNALFLISIPAILTCLFFSKELIDIFAGAEYQDAATSLQVYSLFMLTSLTITLAGTRMYVARQKEKKLFNILIMFGLINMGLNYILIKQYGVLGATWATLLANIGLMVTELTLENTWKYVFSKDKLKYIAGAVIVSGIFVLVKFLLPAASSVVTLFIAIVAAGIAYILVMILLQESTAMMALDKLIRR